MNRKAFDLVICSALAAVAMTLALLTPRSARRARWSGCRWCCSRRAMRSSRPPSRPAGWERLSGCCSAWAQAWRWRRWLGCCCTGLRWGCGRRPGRWRSATSRWLPAWSRWCDAGGSPPVLREPSCQRHARRRHDAGRGRAAGPGGAAGRRCAADRPRWRASSSARPGSRSCGCCPIARRRPDSVRLGVSNRESGDVGYRLLVTASGTIIGSWPRITLGPDEQWETTVALPTAQPAATTVEAVLYRLDAPETAYRRVLFRR